MAIEREWKFVVLRGPSVAGRKSTLIEQGYVCQGDGATVRIRIEDGRKATLTVKMPLGDARDGPSSRQEYDADMPIGEARSLLSRTRDRVRKRRYEFGSVELDVFEGTLRGLVLAEVEVGPRSRKEPKPPRGWEWKDVTRDHRYGNSSLAKKGMPWLAPRAVLA
jgi:adenylate cyclase